MSWKFENQYTSSRRTVAGVTMPIVATVQLNEVEWLLAYSDGFLRKYNMIRVENIFLGDDYFDNQAYLLGSHLFSTQFSGNTILSMTAWYDKVYILHVNSLGVTKMTSIWIENIAIIQSYDLPTGLIVGSPIVAGNNKIYLVDRTVFSPTDQNALHVFNIATGTWTNSWFITGKKQDSQREMVDGLDGKLFITAKNEHGIVAYNMTTDSQILYKINRHPYGISVNQNKDIFVCSDAGSNLNEGMISIFNQSTGTAAPFSTACKDSKYVLDDLRTGYMYVLGADQPKISRIEKSTKLLTTTGTEGLNEADFTGGTPTLPPDAEELPDNAHFLLPNAYRGLLTNQVVYDKYDPATDVTTSTTIRPHLILINDVFAYAFRATAPVRVNSSEILGTAMITTGAQRYYGE